jgi:ATP-binding cassette subfamily B protein
MVWQAVQGRQALGDLALFYQAFTQSQRLMRTLLESVGRIYRNMLFLGDLFAFLSLEPEVSDPDLEVAVPELAANNRMCPGISFQGVTFRYPNSQRNVLDSLNLQIEAGQTVALLGSNGAGKSTLVKLLCRFYDPQEGRIEMGGVDLRQWPLDDLRRQLAVLFQDPIEFSDTAAQNLALGDLRGDPDRDDLEKAALSARADEVIARLAEGYDTLLGVWFRGGTDLSIGEWQRVALARTYVRQAPVLVLDEPTGSMDPWTEAEWRHRFRERSWGHTTIVITHRLSTAQCAHVIHLMEGGQIVESGSHEELLAQGGRYAELWEDQMD